MILNKLATNMAHFFYKKELLSDEKDIAVCAYGLEVMFASVFNVIFAAVLGIFLGLLVETLLFFAAFIPLKSYTAGYRSKKHLRYFMFSMMIYAAFVFVVYATPVRLVENLSLSLAALSFWPVCLGNKRLRRIRPAVYFIQAAIIAILIIGGTADYWVLSLAAGQFAAAGSILAARIRNRYAGRGYN